MVGMTLFSLLEICKQTEMSEWHRKLGIVCKKVHTIVEINIDNHEGFNVSTCSVGHTSAFYCLSNSKCPINLVLHLGHSREADTVPLVIKLKHIFYAFFT